MTRNRGSIFLFLLCVAFVKCGWDPLSATQNPVIENVASIGVSGDAAGTWLAAYSFYSSTNTKEKPNFKYFRWGWGENDWLPENTTLPDEVTAQCQLPSITYLVTLEMASGSIGNFVVSFIASHNTDPCICVLAAITNDSGKTWEWHTWPWCSLFPLTTTTPPPLTNKSELYSKPYICSVPFQAFPPDPALASLDVFVAVEMDANDNILLVATDVSPFYNSPSPSSNLMIALYSNSTFTIQYQRSSPIPYGNPVVISGGPGIWLVSGYLPYQNNTKNLLSSFYTLFKVEGAPWKEYPYQISDILLEGVDIATNKDGVWIACISSHDLKDPLLLTHDIICQTVYTNSSTSVPIFDPYRESQNTYKIESFLLGPCTDIDNYLRRDKDFLAWVEQMIIVVYQFMGAYYAYSTDEGSTWSVSPLDTSTTIVPISSQYPVSYGLFIQDDDYSRFVAGYINYDIIWNGNGMEVGVILSTILTDICKQNLSLCDPATTICKNGLNPQSSVMCFCQANMVAISRYECYDINDPCYINQMNCEQICKSESNVSRCYCYSGYSSVNSENHTECNQTTPWALAGLSFGPDIVSPTATSFPSIGLLYVSGESTIKAENLNRIYQYVAPTNRWSGSTLDDYDQITPGVYNNPALCPYSLSLWILGGVTSTSTQFEIWQLDILWETVVKYSLDMSALPNKIPLLQSSSCLVHSSDGNFLIYLYGGYYDNYVVSDTIYEFILLPNATGTVQAFNKSATTSVWPPPLYNSMFVSLTSTTLNLKCDVLVGGRLNQGVNGSLTVDQGPIMYNYLGMGEWEVLPVDDRFHLLPSQGRSYLTSFASNVISILDLQTPDRIFALIQLEEYKTYENGNLVPFWAAVQLWPGEKLNLETWDPFFFGSVMKSSDDTSLVMLAREYGLTRIRVYTLDPQNLVEIDTCQEQMSLCVPPAQCVTSVNGYDCVCPSGYSLSLDGRTCLEGTSYTIYIIIVCVCGSVILLIVAIIVWYFYRQIDISPLPEELRWPFKQYYESTHRGWERQGTGSTKFYSRLLPANSASYERVRHLFEMKLGGSRKEGNLECSAIYSIFNPTLLTAFLTFRNVAESRFKTDEKIFRKQVWNNIDDSDLEHRKFVYHYYDELMKRFNWNDEETIKSGMAIVPALHGTGMDIAWKVAEKGFAGISSLDSGYYGKGVYFTTHALYALPYFATNPKPALIIAYTFPGNVYPVIESHTGPKSLLGKGLVGSSTAHYVLTKIDGSIASMNEKHIFDELVIAQENATLPVFILEIDKTNLLPLINRFTRAIPISSENTPLVEIDETEQVQEDRRRSRKSRKSQTDNTSDPQYQLLHV